jgi:hypothetical protein
MNERGSVVRRTRLVAIGLTTAAALAVPATSASAGTIGSVSLAGTLSACPPQGVQVNTSTGPGDPSYALPAGGGRITSWSTSTAPPSVPGAAVALVVLRPMTDETFSFVAIDPQSLPTPLPAGGLATFSPKVPIIARAGDLIGLLGYSAGAMCTLDPEVDSTAVFALGFILEAPTVGSVFRPDGTGTGSLLNVAATFDQLQDAAVSGAAVPASIVPGRIATYAFTVTNRSAFDGPMTVSAAVPAGLTVLSALVGTGSCSVSGQTVTCTTGRVDSGASVPLTIIVRADSPGTYAVSATVSVIGSDPAPGDNTGGATLTVSPVPVPAPTAAACKPAQLKGLSLALAKRVIAAVNCKLGKVTKAASKKVRKGLVISTSPGAGKTLANGARIKVVQSSGPPRKKRGKRGRTS